MTDQRFGIKAGEFFLTDRKSNDRNVFGGNAGVGKFLIERHIGVTVNGGDHCGFFAGGAKLFDFRYPRLPIRVAKRRVINGDIFFFHTFANQVGFQNFIGGTGVDIICAFQYPAFYAFRRHQIIYGRYRLLVRRRACVEHIFGRLFSLVLHRIKQQAI